MLRGIYFASVSTISISFWECSQRVWYFFLILLYIKCQFMKNPFLINIFVFPLSEFMIKEYNKKDLKIVYQQI